MIIRYHDLFSVSCSLSLSCCRVYRVVVVVVGKRVIVVNSSWLLLVPIGTQLFRWENRTPARSSNYTEKPIRKKRIIRLPPLRFPSLIHPSIHHRSFLSFLSPLPRLVSRYFLSVSTSGDWTTLNEHSRRANKTRCLKFKKLKVIFLFELVPLGIDVRRERERERQTRCTNACKVEGSELTDHNNNGSTARMPNISSRSASSPVRARPSY